MSIPAPRTLTVWFAGTRVGELRENNNVWLLDYDPAWQESAEGFDLSPALPRAQGLIIDGSSSRPVQWFFDNLLPEEGARTLLAQDAGVAQADAFGLLQLYGPESAGALTLLPPGRDLLDGHLELLRDQVLSERIRALPRVPLSHGSPKRMSTAGAQHKLAVVLDEGKLWEPTGNTASTHILKPDHQQIDLYPHSAINEWFAMSLAGAVGLPVPEVVMRYVPEPVYLVQRFDREGSPRSARRLPVLDACQLLSLDAAFKYRQATPATLRQLAEKCRKRAIARSALFRWAVFNAVVGNGDSHLKNISFFMAPQGIDLAPHYDLLSTNVYHQDGWAHEELVTPMGEARRFGEISRTDVLTLGVELGLPERVAGRMLKELQDRIEREAALLLERYEQGKYGPVGAGEARLLRQIVHGPIADMLRQLRQA